MPSAAGLRPRGRPSGFRLACGNRRVLSCVSLTIAAVALVLCAQTFVTLGAVGVLSLWPSLLSAYYRNSGWGTGSGGGSDFLLTLSRSTLRPLTAAEEGGWSSRLLPGSVQPVRLNGSAQASHTAHASLFQLVSHWAVAATEKSSEDSTAAADPASASARPAAAVTTQLLSVHWASVDQDRCPDLFVVTSALAEVTAPPTAEMDASLPSVNITATVSVSRLLSRSCNISINGTRPMHWTVAAITQQTTAEDALFIAGPTIDLQAAAGGAVAGLAMDVDGDYYMDLVLSAETWQRPEAGNSSDRSFLCAASHNQSQVSRLLLPRGSVMEREMGLAPDAAVDIAAASGVAGEETEEEREEAMQRSVNVGLPIASLDWNLDGILDLLLAHTDGETLHYRSLATLRSAEADCTEDCSELIVQRDVFQPNTAWPCIVLLLALVDADLQPELVCFGSAFPRKLRVLRYSHQQETLKDFSWRFRPLPVPSADIAPPTLRHSLLDACVADFNGDGYADYVLATHRQGLVMWLSAPALAPIPPPKPPSTLPSMAVPGFTVHFLAPPWAQQWQAGQRSDSHTAVSVACVDLDNDRDFDVVVLYEQAASGAGLSGTEADDEQRSSAIFLNEGNCGRMQYAGPLNGGSSVSSHSGQGREVAAGAALAVADYNADGRMDVLAASSAGFQLFRNQGLMMNSAGHWQKYQPWRQHWLTVSLWGVGVSNSFGVGAVVQVTGNSGRLRLAQIAQMPSAAMRPYAQSHHVLHFGLGNCSLLESVIVHWPRARQGHVRNLLRFESVMTDQHLHILQLNTGQLTLPANLRAPLAGYHFRQGRCARANDERLRPSFFIVGQFKGGTSSLSASLRLHPSIKPASMKELHYFSHLAADLPLEWYLQHFPCGSPTDRTYEASASYFGSPTVPAALLATFPDAKLIVLLRDPVTRAFSHYRMMFVRKAELLPSTVDGIAVPVDDFYNAVRLELDHFRLCVKQRSPAYGGTAVQLTSETMLDERVVAFDTLAACYDDSNNSTNYVRAGLYEVMLRRWWQALGDERKDQLLIIASETFTREPASVIRRVHQFVGIEPLDEGQYKRENEGVAANMSVAARDMLRSFYRPFNQRLPGIVTFAEGKLPDWIDYQSDD